MISTRCWCAVLALAVIQFAVAALALARLAKAQERPSLVRTWEAASGVPIHSTDRREPAQARHDRIAAVVSAVAFASSSLDDSAALLTLAQHESGLAGYVGRDECAKGPRGEDECDRGRALGYWQVHRSTCPEAWQMPHGAERLRVEAVCALAHYHAARRRCGGTPRGGLAGYRGRCDTSDAGLRARTYRMFSDVLEHGWPRAPEGWERHPRPDLADRKRALRTPRSAYEPRAWIEISDGVRGLVEWHWHPFGGDTRPRGWHLGITLYRRSTGGDS